MRGEVGERGGETRGENRRRREEGKKRRGGGMEESRALGLINSKASLNETALPCP